MRYWLTLSLFFTSSILLGQNTNIYTETDKKALLLSNEQAQTCSGIADYVKANFGTNNEKARAIFIWIATNIRYDIDNMFAINFYEKKEEKIAKALLNRKGICENYAAVFNEVCRLSNIPCVVVEGYVKQNGFVDYIPHAWCAAYIDTAWFMFDPTWGSGYVSNAKFIPKINNEYYKALPAKLIKTHMPFDPMWQFLNYPVTSQEFYEGKTQLNTAKPYFNYIDSIAENEKLDNVAKLSAAARRIEANGIRNSMIHDRLYHIKAEIENTRQNESVNLYNSAAVDMSDGVTAFNQFIEYRNKQFDPVKPDAEIQEMVDAAERKFNAARAKLYSIKNPDANMNAMINTFYKSINENMDLVDQQKDFLKEYFSKGKMGRRNMFYQTTIVGIPVK